MMHTAAVVAVAAAHDCLQLAAAGVASQRYKLVALPAAVRGLGAGRRNRSWPAWAPMAVIGDLGAGVPVPIGDQRHRLQEVVVAAPVVAAGRLEFKDVEDEREDDGEMFCERWPGREGTGEAEQLFFMILAHLAY